MMHISIMPRVLYEELRSRVWDLGSGILGQGLGSWVRDLGPGSGILGPGRDWDQARLGGV